MKNLILTWVIFLGIVTIGFAQVEKTLVKTLPVEDGCIEVTFDLPGTIEVMEWDNKTIRIMTNITSKQAEDKIVKALIASGRYNLKISKDEVYGGLIIDMPKQEHIIIINGVDFEEQLDFEIFVPKGVIYHIKGRQPTIEDIMLM